MKKNFIYLALLIFIIGCSKDEDSIVGSYKMTFIKQSNCTDVSENFELNFGEDGCANNIIEFCTIGTFNFSADGIFSSTVKLSAAGLGELVELDDSGTYTVSGNKITICVPDCGEVILNGNTLTLDDSNDGCDQNIIFTRI